ncbi:MAG TPA: carboxypeptidase M32 [Chloroflexia bacterium]|nr:carboxypeptidase M32 [Chloroflexia bacterium]
MDDAMQQLREILGEVSDLNRAAAVLGWDQETYMPPSGVGARAQQLATLRRLAHTRFTSEETGRLLDKLAETTSSLDPDSDDASLVRVAKRDYDKSCKLPASLVAEVTRASAIARPAWIEARQKADFSIFAPFLETNIGLNKQVADALGYEDHPYDALLDRGEPGMTTTQLRTLFEQLKAAIVPLVRAISDKGDVVDDSMLHREYDEQEQLAFGLQVVQQYGYKMDSGREDLTTHPFCTSFSPNDVRITTRVSRDFLSMALFGTMHESGHGMYEQGVSQALDRTPLCRGASPGFHESQSRLWENLVGRSRPFWQGYFPKLQAAFPDQLRGVDAEGFYRAVNKAMPSLIRVEADEVTYNLHILLRFELELAMLEGQLQVADLPDAWNSRLREYLGISPPDDAEGVLQDIHWSSVSFAGFPSYTLGNVIGAQLFARAHADMPDLDAQIAAGEFAGLHGWLTTNLYQHGRKFTPNELLQRITGGGLDAGPWIAYVRQKFGDLYGLAA